MPRTVGRDNQAPASSTRASSAPLLRPRRCQLEPAQRSAALDVASMKPKPKPKPPVRTLALVPYEAEGVQQTSEMVIKAAVVAKAVFQEPQPNAASTPANAALPKHRVLPRPEQRTRRQRNAESQAASRGAAPPPPRSPLEAALTSPPRVLEQSASEWRANTRAAAACPPTRRCSLSLTRTRRPLTRASRSSTTTEQLVVVVVLSKSA